MEDQMTKSVIMYAEIGAVGRTKEDLNVALDQIKLEFCEMIGGDPWVTHDDDCQRMHMPGNVIADDQGFFYQGKIKVMFGGPWQPGVGMPHRDGYSMQRRGNDG